MVSTVTAMGWSIVSIRIVQATRSAGPAIAMASANRVKTARPVRLIAAAKAVADARIGIAAETESLNVQSSMISVTETNNEAVASYKRVTQGGVHPDAAFLRGDTPGESGHPSPH